MPDMGHFIRAGVEGFPAMPVALYAEAAVYTPAAGSRIMARMEAASFTLPAENSLPCIYLPPGGRDEGAVMGKNGRCIYSPVRIFSDYFHFVQYPLRALLKAAIKELLPEPLIDSGKLPSWVRVTVTEQPGRNMIHLLSFIPERRGESFDVVESAIPFTDAVVRFRTDGKVPARIFLSPDPEKQLKWTTDGNYICIQLPEAGGCTLIVVEWK